MGTALVGISLQELIPAGLWVHLLGLVTGSLMIAESMRRTIK
tara:strand:- start:17 stop:142 length:126 start_codon:yes stop_codon:yes gene_type:complete